jgi:predicted amidohydrolase YtcJ
MPEVETPGIGRIELTPVHVPFRGVVREAMAGSEGGLGMAIAAEEAWLGEDLTGRLARARFEEHEKGNISPGKRADLVVLSESPSEVAPESIREIRVEQTSIAGRVVYGNG